jgi:4-deoxy-L-threo-5-hexosulose-uronate ketol-isomerase
MDGEIIISKTDCLQQMTERYTCSPFEVKGMDTQQLRTAFTVSDLMAPGKQTFVYSHYDRMIIGGIVPSSSPISISNFPQLKSDYFLQRREMGIINIGGTGTIITNKQEFKVDKLDCVYACRGTESIRFTSNNANDPAQFYILSAPAHHQFPSAVMKNADASPAAMGAGNTANERMIYKYIHEEGIKSCQLVMGLTILKPGSVWNTMPPHTHNRRMEVYYYFDVPHEQKIFHFMGESNETRHILMGNNEAIISPPWSIHSGCGTSNYSFIWGMAGENQSFADMDFIKIEDLR